MLKSNSIENQILAINTLGNLQDEQAYEMIEKLVFSHDPILSLWAWRALFRIDFNETLDKYLWMIAWREDWSPTFVVKVLTELNKDLISQPLAELAEEFYQEEISERQLARLISYLSIADPNLYESLVHRILKVSDEKEVIIACLRIVHSHRSLAASVTSLNPNVGKFACTLFKRSGASKQKEDMSF